LFFRGNLIKIDNKNMHGEFTAYSIAFFKVQMKNKGVYKFSIIYG